MSADYRLCNVALLSLLVTAVSIWSIGSLLVAEVAVRIARKREVPIEVTTKALKLVSPLARPLVRKRLASVALTTAILGAGAPAFAAPATEIPSDLGWHSTTTVVNVPQGAGDTQGQSNTNPNHPQANSQAQTEGPQPHSESSPTQTENSRSQGESPQEQAESSRTKSERSGPQNETSPTKGSSSTGEEGSQAKIDLRINNGQVLSEDLTLKGRNRENALRPPLNLLCLKVNPALNKINPPRPRMSRSTSSRKAIRCGPLRPATWALQILRLSARAGTKSTNSTRTQSESPLTSSTPARS